MAQKDDERDWWLKDAAGTNEPRTAFVIASISLTSKSATRKPPTAPPPTENPRYFALNPIIDKFSFKKGCQVRSAVQYKTDTHCSVYHFKRTATAKCLLNPATSVFVKNSLKRGREHGAIFSRKMYYKSAMYKLLDLHPWHDSCLFVSLLSSPVHHPANGPYCCYVHSRMSLHLSPLIISESLGIYLLQRVWTSLQHIHLCFCNS